MQGTHRSPFSGQIKKIFLVGFMGSGKNYWGHRWAAHTGLPFADLDELIEKREKQAIAQVFEQKGEAFFRAAERDCLRNYQPAGSFIMACGGGAACFDDNMQWMNQQGITVYLSALPQTLYERLIGEKDKRPLLKHADPSTLLGFIEQKLKEREPFYKQATYTLAVEELTDDELPSFLIFNS